MLYTALMHPGGYDRAGNYAQYVDGLFLTGHMYSQTKTWDPEGIVSTLPAIATTLFGVLTGMLLRAPHPPLKKVGILMGVGVVLALAGLLGDALQPINKSLWTPTYTLLTAGLASLVFGACYWIADVQGYVRWGRPFAIYGMNAIVVYALSGVLARLMAMIRVGGVPLRESVFNAFCRVASPIDASLFYGLANVAALFLVAWLMHRRGWYVRF